MQHASRQNLHTSVSGLVDSCKMPFAEQYLEFMQRSMPHSRSSTHLCLVMLIAGQCLLQDSTSNPYIALAAIITAGLLVRLPQPPDNLFIQGFTLFVSSTAVPPYDHMAFSLDIWAWTFYSCLIYGFRKRQINLCSGQSQDLGVCPA